MKITVLTLGSRGDVQPYVSLGKALVKSGHHVTICTGKTYRDFVEGHGLTFKKAEADFMDFLKSEEGKAIFNGVKMNIFRILKYTKEVINPAFRKSFDDFLEASENADLIIYHPKAIAAVDIAQYYGIPCLSMPPVPITYPITEFPNLAVSPTKNLGAFLNKLTYKAVKYAEASSLKDINDFRVKVLNMPKRKSGALAYAINGKRIPILYPISNYLFEEVKSWENDVVLSGFFYLDLENNVLDEGIQKFIDQGKKPIVISFSSMPIKNPSRFKEMLMKSLKNTQNRAIILTGNSGMTFDENKDILAVEKAPHRLIFEEALGIIHHGGVGTMAEALLSGVPQVIMPFNVDQPFWAHRLFKQGLALEPLKEKNLTVTDLEHVFIQMEEKEVMIRAREISKKIKNEHGLNKAVAYIESLVK